jgi:DNA-binding GntR family transcriptional regulator
MQWGSYARIAEVLRVRLALLPPGSPVPSETALSGEFGVARNTVRRALGRLTEEGLVGTVPGRGRGTSLLGPGLPWQCCLHIGGSRQICNGPSPLAN